VSNTNPASIIAASVRLFDKRQVRYRCRANVIQHSPNLVPLADNIMAIEALDPAEQRSTNTRHRVAALVIIGQHNIVALLEILQVCGKVDKVTIR
jgi:hypothetical protein